MDPLQPLIKNTNPDQPNIPASIVALGIMLSVLVAFVINFTLIARTIQAGASIKAYPINLVLTVATFAAILAVIAAIIVDQYPCWMGVPNCD